MKNRKILGLFTFFVVFALWMFLYNKYFEHYPLNKSIVMSVGASFLATISFQPINQLMIFLKQKYFSKKASRKRN